MNPLQPLARYHFRHRPDQFNDVEILQTDVMRFFAILCLCLMAIFALLKTLPMAPVDDRPRISEPAALKQETHSLQVQIAALKQKLTETQTQITAASLAAQQSALQARQAEKDEQEFIERLRHTREELAEVSHSLKKTRGRLTKREQKLAELASAIDDKKRIRSQLQTQIEHETQNLHHIQAALERTKEKVEQNGRQNHHSSQKPTKANREQRQVRQGFSLRFASDAALQRLITDGKVKFYAVAAHNAWQLQLTGDRPFYISAESPRQIYQMETATVPVVFVSLFQRQVAAFGRTTLTWGVTLPAETTASISQLLQGRAGGDLVIMPTGEVIMN